MNIRGITKRDYDYIVSVLDIWWGGPSSERASPFFFHELGEHVIAFAPGKRERQLCKEQTVGGANVVAAACHGKREVTLPMRERVQRGR